MKLKIIRVIKYLFYISFLTFIVVFIMSMTTYYDSCLEEKSIKSSALKRFEEDVMSGKEIVAANYLEEDKDYSNLISRSSIKLSNTIEKLFNKGIKLILKELESVID